jgi:feruloyl esterase
MAPGMGHCSGGEGPSVFDMIGALEQWIEQGKAPDQILAAHATGDPSAGPGSSPSARPGAGRVDRTRPLCPYPQIAVYNGTGSIDEAASFNCKAR